MPPITVMAATVEAQNLRTVAFEFRAKKSVPSRGVTIPLLGASINDVRKNFGFCDPLVRKFMQPPLLRLLTMSPFEGTPLPPQCGRYKWKPPNFVSRVSSSCNQTSFFYSMPAAFSDSHPTLVLQHSQQGSDR